MNTCKARGDQLDTYEILHELMERHDDHVDVTSINTYWKHSFRETSRN